MLRRRHLFELEDQRWFPSLLRTLMTDYLAHASGLFRGFPAYAAARIAPVLERVGTRRIVDLGSGSGGVVPDVARLLEERHGVKPQVLLTDRYPDTDALEALGGGRVHVHPEPVDAMAVPGELRGVRTMFLSFHHFRPDQARAILADAVRARSGIAVFELTERRPLSLLAVLPGIPLMVLALTPFIRPFRWSRLLLTYVLPVLPLLILWDGLVSHLRTYSTEEMSALAAEVEADDWEWDVRRERPSELPAVVLSLVGMPAAGADQRPASAASTSRS